MAQLQAALLHLLCVLSYLPSLPDVTSSSLAHHLYHAQETAINIGYACSLITDDMTQFQVGSQKLEASRTFCTLASCLLTALPMHHLLRTYVHTYVHTRIHMPTYIVPGAGQVTGFSPDVEALEAQHRHQEATELAAKRIDSQLARAKVGG